jgi:hypothetical protein
MSGVLRFLTQASRTARRFSSSSTAFLPDCPFQPTTLQSILPVVNSDTAADVGWRSKQDRAEILSGVRRGQTLGSPISLQIRNRRLDELAAHDERRGEPA